MKRINIEEYIGKKYNKLTILSSANPYISQVSGKKERKVLCKCDCGNEKEIRFNKVVSSEIKSCGCLLKEATTRTHGLSYSITYKSWDSMKARCYNKNSKDYKNYGARGIVVCPEWVNSFETFLVDMGERPNKSYSLERDDVNNSYQPSNCKWVNSHSQNANKRNSNEVIGVRFDKLKNKWIATLTVKGKEVLRKSFKTKEEAVECRKLAEIEYKIYDNNS